MVFGGSKEKCEVGSVRKEVDDDGKKGGASFGTDIGLSQKGPNEVLDKQLMCNEVGCFNHVDCGPVNSVEGFGKVESQQGFNRATLGRHGEGLQIELSVDGT